MIEILKNCALYLQRNSVKKKNYEENRAIFKDFKNYRIDNNWSADGLQRSKCPAD